MKKIIAILLSMMLMLSMTACGEKCSFTEEEAMANIDVIEECFDDAIFRMGFLVKSAGNVNAKGSRKVADEFTDAIKTAFDDINMEFVEECLPLTAEKLPEIEEDMLELYALLIDMGQTNSSANVLSIKTKAALIEDDLNELLEDEIFAYMYE